MHTVHKFALAAALCAATVVCSAQPQPRAISDVIPPTAAGDKATHCGFRYGAAPRVDVPVATNAQGGVYCDKDLLDLPVGSTKIDATAVLMKPGFPRVESSPSNEVTVSRAAAPPKATGLVLALCGTTACLRSAAVPAGVTDCGWQVDGAARTYSAPVAGACQANAVLAAGAHTANLTWRAADPLFGAQEGAQSDPTSWSVPAAPGAPTSLRAQP